MFTGLTNRLKAWLYQIGFIILILALIMLGEWLPPMPAFQRFQDSHLQLNRVLIGITLAMTVLGWFLLVFTQFLVRVPDPRQAQTATTRGIQRGPGRFFSGIKVSAGFSDEVRMWRVKKVFRDGDWWRVPRWRRMSLMMLGAILIFYGLFGFIFLLFPPGLKFFLFLVVLYATVRTVYAFAADRPSRS
jgi:hypothetical protein